MTAHLANQEWFQRIMKSEGGFNPKEPALVGGKSYAGITQKTYDSWREQEDITIFDTPLNVEDLAGNALGTDYEKASPLEIPHEYGVRIDVIIAFYTDYFKKAYIELLPECLQYMHADFFTNAMFTANKILQKIVGFDEDKGEVDGILGPESRAKLQELCDKLALDMDLDPTADDDLIMAYHELKLAHYESLNKPQTQELYNGNIKGWRKRAMHVLSELEDYFYDENPTTSAIHDPQLGPILFDAVPTEGGQHPEDTEARDLKDALRQIQKILGEVLS